MSDRQQQAHEEGGRPTSPLMLEYATRVRSQGDRLAALEARMADLNRRLSESEMAPSE